METMQDMQNRIREIRKSQNLSLEALAAKIGGSTTKTTIMKLEKGNMQLTTRWMSLIAAALQCTPEELISDRTHAMVAVVGVVVNGEIQMLSEEKRAKGTLMLECPSGVDPRTVDALVVEDDSHYPLYRKGDVVYLLKETGILDEFMGTEHAVQTDGGKVLLRILERASAADRYNLSLFNVPPMNNVQLDWARKVKSVVKA